MIFKEISRNRDMEDEEPVIDNSIFLVKLTLLKWLKTNVALSLKFVFE